MVLVPVKPLTPQQRKIVNAFNRTKRLREEEEQEKFLITNPETGEKMEMDRHGLMELTISLMRNCLSLKEICSIEGMPTPAFFYRMRQYYPQFDDSWYEAEEAAGHIAYDEAEEVARFAMENPKAAFGAQILTTLLAKRAARSNYRFQDKAVVQHQEIAKLNSPDDIKARIRQMLDTNPKLLQVIEKVNAEAGKPVLEAKVE